MDGTVIPTNPILPDFTRFQWASPVERAWWLPLIQEAAAAYVELERLAVVHGVRFACWQNIHPDTLVSMTQWARSRNLVCVPTNITRRANGYSNTADTIRPGDAYDYRCLFIHSSHYANFQFGTDDERGKLLGYPTCCRRHFAETWSKGQVDSTWEQWQNTTGSFLHGNTLLRSMGIRAVSHMPCAFNCPESVSLAQDMMELGLDNGLQEPVRLLHEVMQWPIEWSRLFGIAEYVTPALKIVTRTDWTPTTDRFSKQGQYHKPEATLWTDNGFNDPVVMRQSHNIILDSLKTVEPGQRVQDLGCGNGLLLKRLRIARPDVTIGGVDVNDGAIKRAGFGTGKWRTASIESVPAMSDVWTTRLINPLRLLEMDPSAASNVRLTLSGCDTYVYAYPDALKNRSLEELCVQAGLPVPQMQQKTPLVSVGLIPRA
jgi:hypothetical protein